MTQRSPRRLFFALSLPTLGLAFALTLLTTYGPIVLVRISDSPARVGALIGGEGAFALAVPLIAGTVSDRLRGGRLGRRLPLVLLGTPLIVFGLLLLPLAPGFGSAGLAVLAFFVGYYLYYPPYRAVYADLVPRAQLPRAQSGQAIARGAGLGGALLVGALLLSVWSPAPFIVGAAVMVATTSVLAPLLLRGRNERHLDEGPRPVSVWQLLVRHGPMRSFAAANALWELSFTGLRTFIILYVVKGLGHSPRTASAVIAVVAVAYVVGAPLAARLAHTYGLVTTMGRAGAIYGVALCLAAIPHSIVPLLVLLPFAALAGAVLLTLPPALAFTVAPDGAHGTASGIIDMSRGVGVVLGPVLVGAAISASGDLFASTHGYAAMWPVIGIPILLAIPLLYASAGGDQAEATAGAQSALMQG